MFFLQNNIIKLAADRSRRETVYEKKELSEARYYGHNFIRIVTHVAKCLGKRTYICRPEKNNATRRNIANEEYSD